LNSECKVGTCDLNTMCAHPRAIQLTIRSSAQKFKASFSSKPYQIPTLGVRIAPELEKIGFKRNTVSRLRVPATHPWLPRHPEIDVNLLSTDKAVTPPEVFKVRF